MTAAVLAAAALSATVMGCELIASVDRSIINGTGGGGTGGATATATTTTVGSTGGAAATTGVGGATASSSSTGAPMCVDPAKDCPPPASECVTAVCDGAGLCMVKNVNNGVAVTMQTAGDCKKVVCDGAGKTTSIDDNADVNDDAKECTTDTCSGGVPVHTPVAVNTMCGVAGGTTKCDATGECVGCITAIDCGAAPACKVATCTAGVCGTVDSPNATACNDGNACTQVDTCQAGVCTGASPVVCSAMDQCHNVGTCDMATGMCSNPMTGDGAACSDGNACTTVDTCQTGVCTGATPVVCMAMDQCHTAGTCAPATGMCSNPTKANGVACDDLNNCTTGDSCTAGACTGTPVVCTALDTCHTIGTCNMATGMCSNPNAANGTVCNDANNCTTADVCTAGSCAGTTVVCSALDTCHVAGTCNAATGTCSNPAKGTGSACDDMNLCTTSDMCSAAATCSGTATVCPAPDQCHLAGTCASATGICSNPAVPDGTPCVNPANDAGVATCVAGVCQ